MRRVLLVLAALAFACPTQAQDASEDLDDVPVERAQEAVDEEAADDEAADDEAVDEETADEEADDEETRQADDAEVLPDDEPADEEATGPEPSDAPIVRAVEDLEANQEGTLLDAPESWSDGRSRWFVAGSFDLGFLYVRPRFQFGYGKPHNLWAGLEINPTIWTDAIGGYGGLRIDVPFVNFRVGARYVRPTFRSHLTIQDSYTRNSLNEDQPDEGSQYLAAEAELTLTLPVSERGSFLSETSITYITLVPDDRYVYESYHRIVAAPPWIWKQRMGYQHGFGENNAFRIGVVAELIGSPGRDLIAFRAGLQLRLRATPRVEVRAAWIPAIVSRDELGVRGGNFGVLGIRYRWATGGVTGATEEN